MNVPGLQTPAFVECRGAVVSAPDIQGDGVAADFPRVVGGVVIQRRTHMPAPGVFVYAQVVDVQTFLIHEHRVIFGDFHDAEAVAQQNPILHGDKNRAVGVLQQLRESGFVIFLRPGAEQVGADFVVDFPHLKQQINHSGNLPDGCKTYFHGFLLNCPYCGHIHFAFIYVVVYHKILQR